jgi:hypothetical protein
VAFFVLDEPLGAELVGRDVDELRYACQLVTVWQTFR